MRLKRLINKYAYCTSDSDELRLYKSLILIISVCTCVFGIAWSGFYYVFLGFGIATVFPLLYAATVILSIFISHYTNNYKLLIYLQLICIPLVVILVQWSMGSVYESSFVLIWCFLGSFGAALFLNKKHAKVWMLLFLLIIGVGYIVPLLFINEADIPKKRYILFSLINILILFLIALMANYYVLNQLKKLKTKLFYLFVSKSVDIEVQQYFTTANTPVFGADLKGIINEWNEVTEKITGYSKKEVIGSHWLEYTPINYEVEIKKAVRKALMGKETANYEFSSVSKNGRKIVLLVNINTRRNSNGDIIGVLVLGQDITELDSYRSKLEVKVYERTLKLNEALKKQKEQNELQSKFVSTASHEFRTPLSAINFAAGSIKKYWTKMEPPKIEKKLHRIENQVVHMTELLDDILMVVQGEAGEIINTPFLLNLGDFISEIIDEVYHSFKRSHEIVLIDPQELKNSEIFIDEKLGRNIFINLISNALKFSPEAKKVVVELSSDKKYTVIKIQDFGIGIPKDELKNIFTPFTRGNNVDLIQGTGLGLSIVKEAVNLIGGKIKVNSIIDKGTTFIVKIPTI